MEGTFASDHWSESLRVDDRGVMFEAIYAVKKFPAIPMGGPFITIIGFCIMTGALLPNVQGVLLNVGFILGGLTFIYSWKLSRQLPNMTSFQVICIISAIVIEIAVFYRFNSNLKTLGERSYIISILAIVAAHFIIMSPAYGLAAIALAALCGANSAIAWFEPSYSTNSVWFFDGAIKAFVGITMVLSSPAVRRQNISLSGLD